MNQATADKLSQAINELNNLLQKQGVAAQPEGPAEILLSIVPIVGIIFGCTLLFFYLFWRYRQNKELIRTGKYEATTYANLRSWSLLMGCLCTGVGLPMTILFLVVQKDPYTILGGLIPFSAGIGLLFFYYLTRGSK